MCASDMRALGLVRGLLPWGGEPGDTAWREDHVRRRGVTVGAGEGVNWLSGIIWDGGVEGMLLSDEYLPADPDSPCLLVLI